MVDLKALKKELKGKKVGSYILTKSIGDGGMGFVYEGLKDPIELAAERRSNASKILFNLTGEKVADKQLVEKKLDDYLTQANQNLASLESNAKRMELYQKILLRIDPKILMDPKSSVDPKSPADLEKLLDPKLLPAEFRKAIKFMNPEDESSEDMRSVERFQKEIEAQSCINHPNIVKVFGAGETKHEPSDKKPISLQYFVMEHVDVAKSLQKEAFKDLNEAVKVAYEALKGIMEVHKNGFVHRDIKPRNILYAKDGTVKLSDFGLVKAINKSSQEASLTGTGHVIGTPHFMAPETARGQKAIPASDVYSLGGTLYYFVIGHPPVQDTEKLQLETMGEIALKEETVTWPRRRDFSISCELERLIMKMLAKNAEDRPTTQEIKEDMENIMKKDAAVYREPSAQEEQQRMKEIETLKKDLAKWRIGSQHKTLAAKYERLSMLYIANTQEEINARIDALRDSIEHYRKSNPVMRSDREHVERKISRLQKEIAFELRRIDEINTHLPKSQRITRVVKQPKDHKKTTAITAGIAAGIVILGSLGYLLNERSNRGNQERVRIEQFNSSISEIERALNKKEYMRAKTEIKRAEEGVKELPGAYLMKFKEITDRVENSQNYDRAASLYTNARESAGKKDFISARTSAEQATGLESKISDSQLKKKLDEAKLDIGDSAYEAVQAFLQNEEHREAATGLELVKWILEKTTTSDGAVKERSDALKEKVKTSEARMAQYTPQIKIFEEQMQSINRFNTDYTRIREQLKEDKFCKRDEIEQLGKTLDGIAAKLSNINPNTVGKEEHAKQTGAVNKAKSTIQPLRQEFDSQLVSYLTKQTLKIEQLLATDDYTQTENQEKFKTASSELQAAQSQYESARTITEFASIEQKLNAQAAQLKSLQEKATLFSAMTNQAVQGTNAEKAAANTNRLKIYIGFSRFEEAEKCMASIPNKAGLESYVAILELEKRLSNPNQAKTLPPGFTEEMANSYTAIVNAYKKDTRMADRLKLQLALIADKTGADMKPAQTGVSDVRDLEEQVAELRQKTQTPELKKQLNEQAKLLEDRKNAVYSLLDSYVKPAGTAQPAQELIRQLQSAYRAAGYEKQAEAVPQRFK